MNFLVGRSPRIWRILQDRGKKVNKSHDFYQEFQEIEWIVNDENAKRYLTFIHFGRSDALKHL